MGYCDALINFYIVVIILFRRGAWLSMGKPLDLRLCQRPCGVLRSSRAFWSAFRPREVAGVVVLPAGAPHLNGGISRDNVICWNIST